ncbi:MAG: Uma2 family endonuclease [Planctomycetes bacterium]|nr:Uma2 family endonuclease [Planctomycetota bacterium]
MATVAKRTRNFKSTLNGKREPAWEIATFFPMQGDWTEEEYLALDRNSEPRLIELNNGFLEILPMPDMLHQDIVRFIFLLLDAFVTDMRIGRVYFAPLPVKLWTKQMREPDIVFLASRRIKNKRKPPKGADLAMEVVSPDPKSRRRDLQEKREVYAKAKIPEYWIVDPKTKTITVLTLSGQSYKVHGVFKEGEEAISKLLKGFKVAVSDVFAAGEGK